MTITDTITFDITTDSNGNAYFAFNFNGCPGQNSDTGMLLHGNPGAPAFDYHKFPKFTSGQVNRIWEQVRCSWVKFKYYPIAPYVTTTGVPYITYYPAFVIKERDGIDWDPLTAFPTDDQMLSDPSTKVYNVAKPFTIFQRSCKYPILGKIPPYPSSAVASNTGANIWGQWHGIDDHMGSLNDINSAHIYAKFSGQYHGAKVATVVVTAKFQCKGNYHNV